MVLWRGFPPRDANILLRARRWIDLFSITVSTYVLLTSYVKFGHPCGLYCKVSHRQGRPVFNKKPGIVEPSARQLRARSSTCLQSWSNSDTFRTFDFACPANRSSGLHAPIEPHRRILKRGSYLRLGGKCLSFLPAGTMAHMCPRCPLPRVPKDDLSPKLSGSCQ